jgi:hypothetical protein
MIKSIINHNTDVVTTKLKEIWLVLRRGRLFFRGAWLFAVWEGRVGIGKKKEKLGRRGSVEWWYINFCWWNHRRTHSFDDFVGNSDGESVMSLYGDPGLNPSVIPSVKLLAETSTSTNRFFLILNIPSVIPSVYTDWITDGKDFVGNYDRKLPT